MVQNVSLNQYPNSKPYVEKRHKTQRFGQNSQTSNSPAFGYEEQNSIHPVKRLALALLNDSLGFVGVNLLLWKMQSFVNGKILVGKINKHFTKDITDTNQLEKLAFEMREKEGLEKTVQIFRSQNSGEAYFSHLENKVVVGKDSYSSLFHEIGHAVIENKTTVLKKLQRFRGNYTVLALGLYALTSQIKSDPYEDWKTDPVSKTKNFLNRNKYIIPLLAFSPELITEFKASQYGLKFLKGKVLDKTIEQSLVSKIRKSYITCFSTYLFIPVSIMLIDALRNSVDKKIRKN